MRKMIEKILKISFLNKENYVKEVRMSDLKKPGDDDLIDKLLSDFNSKNLNINRATIVQKIDECAKNALNEYIKD